MSIDVDADVDMAGGGVPAFVTRLRSHAGGTAVLTPDGTALGYADLADRVDALAHRLGSRRRLVLVAAANDVDALVGYLAGLAGGHAVLLAARGEARHLAALVAAYDPDAVLEGPDLRERRRRRAHTLHPDLALLLCTSGSTGSPKLVRLSVANLESNAAAIAEYLDVRPSDRAALTLPLHYCYGLSVVNSNLLRGAAVLLSDLSVTDPRFWTAFRASGGTSLHGVPYTFDLLDRVGFADMALPHLRYITQAGGRLAPDRVRGWAALGERRGWRFVVMYGQTEATARMAYLPPELVAAAPSAIGRPIPGGSFTVEPCAEAAGPGEGELVFHGPGVMLGYADGPADLARGRTVHALRTGDLGRRRPDGLYEVTGRRSRFVKPFGLRIDLGQVERLLADEGCTAACTGSDDALTVVVGPGPEPDRVRDLVAERTGLPAVHVRVLAVPALPRTASGKIDHAAVRDLCRGRRRPALRRPRTVREAFRAVFGVPDLPDHATFVTLGGDSLSYVRMTIELQRVLGDLPADWHTTPIGRLAELTPHRGTWATMEMSVVLRAVSIVLVVGSHAGLFSVLGGAHLLFAVAGWAFARFVLSSAGAAGLAGAAGADLPARILPVRILRSLARIAVPTALWIGWRASVQDDVHLSNALLLNWIIDPASWGYWYVETLVQTLLVLALLFACPAARRLERARPFGFAVAVLFVAVAVRAIPDPGNEFSDRLMSPHLLLWLFVLGWVVHRASTPGRRWAAAALVLALVPGFFDETARGSLVVVGLLLLLLAPRVRVPRWVLRPVGAVASASLTIYLTHYAVVSALAGVPPLVVLPVCVAVGVVACRSRDATTALLRRASRPRGQLAAP